MLGGFGSGFYLESESGSDDYYFTNSGESGSFNFDSHGVTNDPFGRPAPHWSDENDPFGIMDQFAKRKIHHVHWLEEMKARKINSEDVEKDVPRPKRPKSAYFLFLADERLKIPLKQKLNFDGVLDVKSQTREIEALWKTLSSEQRAVYQNREKILKQKYAQDIKKYELDVKKWYKDKERKDYEVVPNYEYKYDQETGTGVKKLFNIELDPKHKGLALDQIRWKWYEKNVMSGSEESQWDEDKERNIRAEHVMENLKDFTLKILLNSTGKDGKKEYRSIKCFKSMLFHDKEMKQSEIVIDEVLGIDGVELNYFLMNITNEIKRDNLFPKNDKKIFDYFILFGKIGNVLLQELICIFLVNYVSKTELLFRMFFKAFERFEAKDFGKDSLSKKRMFRSLLTNSIFALLKKKGFDELQKHDAFISRLEKYNLVSKLFKKNPEDRVDMKYFPETIGQSMLFHCEFLRSCTAEKSNSNLILFCSLKEKTDFRKKKKFYVHKEILMLNSNFFYMMLSTSNWMEGNEKEIEIQNLSEKELEMFLDLVYLGHFSKPLKIGLTSTKEECFQALGVIFNVLNHSEQYFEKDFIDYILLEVNRLSLEFLENMMGQYYHSLHEVVTKSPVFLNEKYAQSFVQFWRTIISSLGENVVEDCFRNSFKPKVSNFTKSVELSKPQPINPGLGAEVLSDEFGTKVGIRKNRRKRKPLRKEILHKIRKYEEMSCKIDFDEIAESEGMSPEELRKFLRHKLVPRIEELFPSTLNAILVYLTPDKKLESKKKEPSFFEATGLSSVFRSQRKKIKQENESKLKNIIDADKSKTWTVENLLKKKIPVMNQFASVPLPSIHDVKKSVSLYHVAIKNFEEYVARSEVVGVLFPKEFLEFDVLEEKSIQKNRSESFRTVFLKEKKKAKSDVSLLLRTSQPNKKIETVDELRTVGVINNDSHFIPKGRKKGNSLLSGKNTVEEVLSQKVEKQEKISQFKSVSGSVIPAEIAGLHHEIEKKNEDLKDVLIVQREQIRMLQEKYFREMETSSRLRKELQHTKAKQMFHNK